MSVYTDSRRFVKFGRIALLPILGGITFLLLSLYALIPLIGDYRAAQRLLNEGKVAEASVVACTESMTGDGPVHSVLVKAPGFENFAFDRKEALKVGSNITLKYLVPAGGANYFNSILCIESASSDTAFDVMSKLSQRQLWKRFLGLSFCLTVGLAGIFIWVRMLRGSRSRLQRHR